MTLLFLIGSNVALLVAGQCFWKLALQKHPLTTPSSWLSLLTQPYIVLGCSLYVVATLVWFYVLSRYDLSKAYPLQSLAYVFGAISGMLIFKEVVTFRQWIGMALIVGGATVLAK